MAKVFVALYECMHWLVDSSVVLGLNPGLNPTSSADELTLAYQLWQKYSLERNRRSDALRSALTELYGTLYKAVTELDAASNTPRHWCEVAVDIDVGEPWRAWCLRVPELHPYNVYFRPRYPGFPVIASAESDFSHVHRLVDEVVDLAESAPANCSPCAPTPANREGLDIFGSSGASPDVTLGSSVSVSLCFVVVVYGDSTK
ncbi:unnamed protein product [Phytophthora fragariaefolia]|uniref:Unnamed protein product n=1 Tax=Phytophthora fragariaefolia TaxID=1490495 RepID=A0A9W6WUD2_9STRA|nr:unnamed protein product [Phytophthora fragariaefolia]